MIVGPLFGEAELAQTYTVLGISDNPILGTTRQQLLQQILVALCNV